MVTNQDLILTYGGKAASLIAQYNAGNTDLLFPFTLIDVIEYESGKKQNLDFKGKQIVRGSAIGDEKGLVDVICTIQNVSPEYFIGKVDLTQTNSWSEPYLNSLNSTRKFGESINDIKIRILREQNDNPIQRVIDSSRKPEVISYAKWEGNNDFHGVSNVIIQPQNQNSFRGSVVEHPNIEGHYIINLVNLIDLGGIKISQYLVNSKGEIVKKSDFDELKTEEAKEIVEMKKRTRKVGFVPDTHSSQVEFGIFSGHQLIEGGLYQFRTKPTSNIIFYQERYFLPYNLDESINLSDYEFNRFGKLENEMHLRTILVDDINDNSLIYDKIPSAYIFGGRSLHGMPLEFQPNNMVAFIVPALGTIGGYSLEHNNYRWIQKAKISLLNQRVDGKLIYESYNQGESIKVN